MYAHLHTNSIPASILVGTRLRRGEQIGELGNTGSSTAPHLHFQVMNHPSALDGVGLPFVFDRQVLEGHVAGPLEMSSEEYDKGLPVPFVRRETPLLQRDLMPAETQVFGYNVP